MDESGIAASCARTEVEAAKGLEAAMVGELSDNGERSDVDVEQKVRLSDGAETVLTEFGRGMGPVVLAVHGIPGSRMSWKRLGEHLSGYRVFAYDQRGHGDAWQVSGPMHLAQHVEDLKAVAAAIGEPIYALVGHSWGGAVVILSAAAVGVAKVVPADPMLYVVPGSWRHEFLDDVEHDLSLPAAERARMLEERFRTWHPDDVAGKIHAMQRMTPECVRRLGEENGVDSRGWDLRNVVAEFGRSLLLLVAGPEDSVIRPEDLEALRQVENPHIVLRMFPGEGHNLHRTAFAAFLREVQQFLDGSPAIAADVRGEVEPPSRRAPRRLGGSPISVSSSASGLGFGRGALPDRRGCLE